MNDAQTVFTLFYSLYFAATVSPTGPFQPFDTPAMYGGDGRAWVRFVISFLALNILPLVYFVRVFGWLGSLADFRVAFWPMVALLILSLAGFGFYRIYFGIMLIKKGDDFLFYGSAFPDRLKEELQQRSARQGEVLPHFVPGAIWVFIPLAVAWYWTQ